MDGRCRRKSILEAFLPQELAEERKAHLHICPSTITLKAVVKKGDGGELQTLGVYLVPSSDITADPFFIVSRREIVLCAGPLEDPQILQRRSFEMRYSNFLLKLTLQWNRIERPPGISWNSGPEGFTGCRSQLGVYYDERARSMLY